MEENNKEIVLIPLEDIIPNRFQPRLAFDENELNELANSIKKYGIIQPIVVRKIGEKYEIIAGERRYKASSLAGIKKIPAIINNTDDNTSAEIALLENLQRKNLTVIEEAKSFKKLMDRGFKQETIASKLGISQSSIANKIRLLSLPKSVQNSLLYNKISERHARCLLTLDNEEDQRNMLNRIINERLTVKQTEDEVNKILNRNKPIDPSTFKSVITIDNMPPLEYFDPKNFTVKAGNEPITKQEIENNNIKQETKNIIKSINDKNSTGEGLIDNFQITPNIESIPDNKYDNINPFQNSNNKGLIDQIINNINESEDEPIIEEKPVYNKNYLNTVNQIRNCIKGLDNIDKIKTTEIDLDNKYRIVIEIDKDA